MGLITSTHVSDFHKNYMTISPYYIYVNNDYILSANLRTLVKLKLLTPGQNFTIFTLYSSFSFGRGA